MAGTHISSPPSCWSASGAAPQASVPATCTGYSSWPANTISAPSRPMCATVANSASTAPPQGWSGRSTARQNHQAVPSSDACISQ